MQEQNQLLANQIENIKLKKAPIRSIDDVTFKEAPKEDTTQSTDSQSIEKPPKKEEYEVNENEDKLLSKLKDILGGKKEEKTIEKKSAPIKEQETPPKETEADEKVAKLVKTAAEREIKIESPKPLITPSDQQEEFQSSNKRGTLTIEEAEDYALTFKQLTYEVNKVFVGQDNVVEKVIMSLMCDAHTLLEGVPGLAKTLLIETLGKTIGGVTFERIQFTPDLLPSDIIGGQIFNPKTNQFVTHKGPIFANLVLADEINRAPPKTHAALMEAMQEKKINIENDEFILDRPFFVLATQNPLENKGTYQLPEAVLDRFMFKVMLNYPKRTDELKIITENSTTKKNIQKRVKVILDKNALLEVQRKVKQVYISEKIREYILDLVEASRGLNKDIQGVKFLKYGAGVRASIYLGVAAKARALLVGRNYVLPDDVYYVMPDVFRHRLSLNYRGKAHNISTDKIIEEILKKVNPI